jgi:hypothetical protein
MHTHRCLVLRVLLLLKDLPRPPIQSDVLRIVRLPHLNVAHVPLNLLIYNQSLLKLLLVLIEFLLP